MKKCMTCGYENLDAAVTCLVCKEALTSGFSMPDVQSRNSCDSCGYPMLEMVNYLNCPHCSKVFGENNIPVTNSEPVKNESVNVKIVLNEVLLGELRIYKGQLVFVNSKDYPHKKSLKIRGDEHGAEKVIKHNKSYGKRMIEDTIDIAENDLIEFSSKEDKVLIQIDFTNA